MVEALVHVEVVANSVAQSGFEMTMAPVVADWDSAAMRTISTGKRSQGVRGRSVASGAREFQDLMSGLMRSQDWCRRRSGLLAPEWPGKRETGVGKKDVAAGSRSRTRNRSRSRSRSRSRGRGRGCSVARLEGKRT